jgi:hypothetical protein
VSLLAGIDLLTGKVHAVVKDKHRSREFIEFLKHRSEHDRKHRSGTELTLGDQGRCSLSATRSLLRDQAKADRSKYENSWLVRGEQDLCDFSAAEWRVCDRSQSRPFSAGKPI